MTLERISFKKGREHKPRLSTPYVPGVRDERYWTGEEDQVLRDHYPTKGFAYCANRLPNRTKGAIYGRVVVLGIKRGGKQQRKSRSKTEYAELDARITEAWPTVEIPKGDLSGVTALAEQLGEPRWLVSQRCNKLVGQVACVWP